MPNPFFSGRIPKASFDRIEEHLKTTGESKTQFLINALSAHIGASLSPENNVITDGIESRLSAIEKRLEALEGNVIDDYQSDNRVVDGWLTTGEAYLEVQRRGYTKSIGTFRRSLSGGTVPEDLTKLGLTADFQIRNRGNLKDNSVKWLKINTGIQSVNFV